MDNVTPFITRTAVDAAWDAYARLCETERQNPALIHDRAHVERRMLAHDRFQQLFLAGERTSNVVKIGEGR